ncbi:hypothetical protein [Massilia varians]|uniref:hypothetical protein n=1 Tax=Massilia varians TaxID=457921 RepID=UPI0025576BBD|nr:hypothetical protein [Massilia varians]MDK6078355.1 hypothetical protein [Massilia varians]
MATVVSAEEMQRRRWIQQARRSEAWTEVKASFAISGLTLTDSEDVIGGRLISGAATVEQIIADLTRQYKVES